MIRFDTERLCIRQLRPKDTEGFYELVSNPRVHCFAQDAAQRLEDARNEVLAKATVTDGSELAVCLKESDMFIGRLFGHWEGDTFGVCWNFLPKYGGKGYAYEAASAYLDFLFKQMKARRVYAYVEDDNISSQRLCERLGMRQEGLFKEFVSFVNDANGNPIYEDTKQYALLRHEWKEGQ